MSRRQKNPRVGHRLRHGGGIVGHLFIGLVLLLAFGVGVAGYQLGTVRSVTFTISDKAVKTQGDGDGGVTSKYLIFTTAGVFENTDALFHLKYRSSDLYAQLKKEYTYTCKVYGWRVPLLSMYPNLVSCE